MPNDILTPSQAAFLERFFATDVSRRFFLTGGTALAAFHLHHRLSHDLDLFTLDDDALDDVDRIMGDIIHDLGATVGRTRRVEHFRQFHLVLPGDGPEHTLQVDLVREFGPQFGQHQHVGSVIVDSVENIGVNKVNALLGRTASKDFVDLYFILQAGYDFQDLFAKAQKKDPGLVEFFFAGALLQVNKLTILPEMIKPVELETIQAFFTKIANEMIDRLNPEQDPYTK
ncbi:MAG: nucleotidyl transferase AbiEii/AbiGii toxin family protein [Anaerolineae bacterium]|nr:nucleotidyl transferase AbiEii/AbiGii toxin family protein [Anaerolineae bacterium]